MCYMRCTLCSEHYVVCTVQCVVYSIMFAVCSVQCLKLQLTVEVPLSEEFLGWGRRREGGRRRKEEETGKLRALTQHWARKRREKKNFFWSLTALRYLADPSKDREGLLCKHACNSLNNSLIDQA